ncbi:hypothetical protein PMKS-000165 [Pichia membranifaciens]|uniref:Uncharacterized protein n=1 Tax=Pichia membranifaciens TaxID=4926 RepID=A0A1Q2YB06_9ASCO|nr:hypothetical protein PMKS-000165 [Pichia membranifaciens]
MIDLQELYKKNADFRESRLKSLFSDYSQLKESNPEGYSANLNVWKHFLSVLFESQFPLSFDYEHLSKELVYKTNNRSYIPEGLYIAINDLLNEKSIIFLSQLKVDKTKEGKSDFLETIKMLLFGPKSVDIRSKEYQEELLISVSKLQKYADKVKYSLLPLLEEGPVNLDHLQDVLDHENLKISKADLVNVLIYLRNQMPNINIENEILYSITSDMPNEDVRVNTDGLKNLTDLNFTIYKLHMYNEEKSKEIIQLNEKISQSIKNKSQATARSQLKLKKMLELQVQKTLSSLENLHTLKLKLEDAHNNVMISKVWKDNSKILKLLNDEATDKDLDLVFDSLYDEIQNTNTVSEKLAQGATGEYNDEEIEQELFELEASVKRDKEISKDSNVENIRKKLASLKIPDTKPQVSEEFNSELKENPREESSRNKEGTALNS